MRAIVVLCLLWSSLAAAQVPGDAELERMRREIERARTPPPPSPLKLRESELERARDRKTIGRALLVVAAVQAAMVAVSAPFAIDFMTPCEGLCRGHSYGAEAAVFFHALARTLIFATVGVPLYMSGAMRLSEARPVEVTANGLMLRF